MAQSSIEWTENTWNPVTGCTDIGLGCENCYAKRLALRLQAMGQPNYANGFQLTLQPHMLDRPLEWKKPSTIFVNSMSDLFHRDVPFDYIRSVFDIMRRAQRHQFQVLTKRSQRLAYLNPQVDWPPNVWMGVSVENSSYTFRIDHLRTTDAALRFLSLEPLLGPLPRLDLTNIHWVIVGGESGPDARPMNKQWVLDIRDQCLEESVPFFFKQVGSGKQESDGTGSRRSHLG